MLDANRYAVDRAAALASSQSNALVKTLWKLTDGSSVIIYTTRGLLTECLLTSPRPVDAAAYYRYRLVAWAGFLAHVLSLGMAALPSQLLCIAVLAVSTTATVIRVGCDNFSIGTRVKIRRFDEADVTLPMAAMFARLQLSQEEEKCLIDWRVMPLPRNKIWWEKYRAYNSADSLAAF